MTTDTRNLLAECREKLLQAKQQTLTRLLEARVELNSQENTGDEVDQSQSSLTESRIYTVTERLRKQLMEIETALARIQTGRYGICEVTEEPIEADRLKAIPWTRYSIEGAETKEALGKRFA